MNEPTIKIRALRTQRIYVVEGEQLIVTPERARALEGFVAPVVPDPPKPKDRMVRPPRPD